MMSSTCFDVGMPGIFLNKSRDFGHRLDLLLQREMKPTLGEPTHTNSY